MRKVDRSRVSVPASLDGPGCAAQREHAAAVLHYQSAPAKAFEFSAYKSQDVVDALNALFFGKCAYCESSIKAVQPTDIEHFRPKGGVTGHPGHPGYWWLAGKWDNLLASCIDCNRQRRQDAWNFAQDPLDDKRGEQYLLGKGNLFPILGARHAHAEADDHDAENCALIDPTRRDPKVHLQWILDQDLSVIGPRFDAAGTVDPYGRHSYRVYGLNRQALVDARTERLREIRKRLVFIELVIDEAIEAPEPKSSILLDAAFEQFIDLQELAEPDQPYSALVADFLERESERLTQKYALLTP